jgi:GNAT superfamily N-acetyltransferase
VNQSLHRDAESGGIRTCAEFSIRKAKPTDAMAIATVYVRSWQAAYPGLVPQSFLDSLTPEGQLGQWQMILASPLSPVGGALVLVTDEDRIVGFASFGASRDDNIEDERVGEVMTLYLDPSVWHRGVGAKLLNESVEELARDGYRLAILWVLETNARARDFYEHMGWRRDGTSKLHDWNAFVATDVRYRLELTRSQPSFR